MGKNSTCNAFLSPTRIDIGGEDLKAALQRTRRVDLLNQKRARLVVFVVQKVLRQLHSYISQLPQYSYRETRRPPQFPPTHHTP